MGKAPAKGSKKRHMSTPKGYSAQWE